MKKKLNKEIVEKSLTEAEEMMEAIRADSVDAFAVMHEGKSHIRTLAHIDYTYSLLIEKMNEGAVSITETGLVVYCNACFSKMVDIPPDVIIGTYIIDLIDEEYRTDFKDLMNTTMHGHSKGEIVMDVNRNKIPVYISLTSLQPQLAAIGIVITDLTEKKKVEALINKYQFELEKKIKQLNETNSELKQFAYIISHDLKEPVRKIATYADLLAKRLPAPANLESLQSAETIKDSALRMRLLIDDLLTFTTTTSHDAKSFVKINLNVIVQKVLDDLELRIKEKNCKITVNALPEIQGIPSQMSQLFQNLIMNALKYNDSAAPEISIQSEIVDGAEINRNDAKFYKLSVRDNGIGFDPKYKDRIFAIFQRLHNQKDFSGTGIGLAICKKIVENHSGVITADGEPGKGAVFTVYLPT